jgi:hypothetical protein
MKKYLIGLAVIFAASLLSLGQANAQVPWNPCNTTAVQTTVKISATTAATTELVALAAGQIIYVCDFSLSISQVVTTANTIKFVYGTGVACATGTTDITGAFGSGGITAGAPITISGKGLKTAAANALCITTTIGATAFFSGHISYIQQ